MGGTLVLNATFQPLNVVTVGRAIALIHEGKAILEHGDERRILRSPSVAYPTPLVIRLLRYVRVPRHVTPFSRRAVLARDGFRCQYDDCTRTATTVDHLLPISRGGPARDYRNVVAACPRHNHSKADRTPEEAGLKLRQHPRVPSVGDLLLVKLDPAVRDWLTDLGL